MDLNYRLGVVGVFINNEDNLLLGERSDILGQWQFPQGGIEQGENIVDALYREMLEEVGCNKFSIIKQAPDTTSYLFPEHIHFPKDKVSFDGQIHYWFLLKFDEGMGPDLSKIDDEFLGFKWESSQYAVDHIIDWKKPSYIKGLGLLGFKVK